MRPATVFCALAAATAARIAIHLIFSPRAPRPPPPPPSPPPPVAAALDRLSPPLRGDIWRRLYSPSPCECSFCLETIYGRRNEMLRETPCRHVFHARCLEQWVYHCVENCLDWTMYSVADDGAVSMHTRMPSCPNCSRELDVVPEGLMMRVILIAVARALNLSDLQTARDMFELGLVFRAEGGEAGGLSGDGRLEGMDGG